MSSCSGCFPDYQPNQLAHMDIGGCLYVDDYDMCMPTNSDRAAMEEENECCICYDTIGEKNNCITDCGHRFCFGCMLKAMTYNTSCPCCRKELLEEDEKTEIDESDTAQLKRKGKVLET